MSKVRSITVTGTCTHNQYIRFVDALDDWGTLGCGYGPADKGTFQQTVEACSCRGVKSAACRQVNSSVDDRRAVVAILTASGIKGRVRFVWTKRESEEGVA